MGSSQWLDAEGCPVGTAALGRGSEPTCDDPAGTLLVEQKCFPHSPPILQIFGKRLPLAKLEAHAGRQGSLVVKTLEVPVLGLRTGWRRVKSRHGGANRKYPDAFLL